MLTFRHTIGQAKCWREKSLVHVDYTGIITNSVMQNIGPRVVEFCGSDCVLIHFDRATMCWPYEIAITENVCLCGYGAFVVKPEHRLDALEHCLRLAKVGVYRDVFLAEEIQVACRTAGIRARIASCIPTQPNKALPVSPWASCQTSIQVERRSLPRTKESSR